MPLQGAIHNVAHLVKPPAGAAEAALGAGFRGGGQSLLEAQFQLWFDSSCHLWA